MTVLTVDRNEGLAYEFESATTTPLEVELRHQGELVHSQMSTYSAGKQHVDINPEHFEYNGQYDLKVGSDDDIQVEVYTALLTLAEMQAIAPNLNESELRFVEQEVRYVIETYTQQVFAPIKATHTVKVYGNGTTSAYLPHRIISADLDTMYAVDRDNWGLKYLSTDEYVVNPITLPGHGRRFVPGEYSVAGVWGWEAVPEKVKFAAKKLLNDYACSESLWRNRYVKDISTMEWKLSFMGAAFYGTGNVIADQVLSEFCKTKIGVV